MTLQGRIALLISSIGADIKTVLGRSLPAGGTSGQVLAKTSATDYAVSWQTVSGSGGADSYAALTYAASIALDFGNGNNVQSVALTGNVTFTTTGRAVTKGKVVRISCDTTARTLTFPTGWIFLGVPAPGSIAASKTAVLSLYCFGGNDTDIIASYAVQP